MAELKYNIKKQKATQDREKILEEQKRFITFINNLKNENASLLKNPNEILNKLNVEKGKGKQESTK